MTDLDLQACPRLADGLEVVYGPADSVQLRGITPPIRLTGGLAPRLLPLLDGTCPVADLLTSVSDWPQEDVLRALDMLNARGLIRTGRGTELEPARSEAAFYWSATTGPASRGEEVLQTLAGARIHLYGWGSLAGTLADALQAGGDGLVAELWAPPPEVDVPALDYPGSPFPDPAELGQRIQRHADADLVVLALPRSAPGLTLSVNAACVGIGVPFLPVVINGVEATVGPAVVGGRSACYHCFKLRLFSNAPFPDDDLAYESALDHPQGGVTPAQWPPFTATVASWAAMEAIRLVTRFVPPVTLGQVCFLHALTGQFQSARVWKIPRCPVCSRAPGRVGGGDGSERPHKPGPDC